MKIIKKIFENPLLGCLSIGITIILTAFLDNWALAQYFILLSMFCAMLWFLISFIVHSFTEENTEE